MSQNPEPFLERFFLTDFKYVIKKFPTEKISSEVRPKNCNFKFFLIHFQKCQTKSKTIVDNIFPHIFLKWY